MTMTTGTVTTTTMTMAGVTTVTATATTTMAAPLHLPQLLPQVVALHLPQQLPLAESYLASTTTTATTTTMTQALHQLQPLPAVGMPLLLPQLPPQVTSASHLHSCDTTVLWCVLTCTSHVVSNVTCGDNVAAAVANANSCNQGSWPNRTTALMCSILRSCYRHTALCAMLC